MRNVNGPCRVLSRVPKGSLGRPECVACLPNTAVALQCASDSTRSKHVDQYDRSVTDGHRAKCTGGLNDFLCIVRAFGKGMLEHLDHSVARSLCSCINSGIVQCDFAVCKKKRMFEYTLHQSFETRVQASG